MFYKNVFSLALFLINFNAVFAMESIDKENALEKKIVDLFDHYMTFSENVMQEAEQVGKSISGNKEQENIHAIYIFLVHFLTKSSYTLKLILHQERVATGRKM